jgi:hypothetical protein
MISSLKISDQNNMKRKPSHLIIYFLYKNEERRLYKFLSKITHSVIGSTNNVDDIIKDIEKFITKYEGVKLKQINLTSYGTGYSLVEGLSKGDVIKVIDSLKPIITHDTKIMFTTCYSGSTLRKIMELSEYYDGMEIYGMSGNYKLTSKMNKCKCKERGLSQKIINDTPESKYGFEHDEVMVVNTIRRDENEKINWGRCGMAYEYDKTMKEMGICEESKQPYTLLKSIRNYLCNIQ